MFDWSIDRFIDYGLALPRRCFKLYKHVISLLMWARSSGSAQPSIWLTSLHSSEQRGYLKEEPPWGAGSIQILTDCQTQGGNSFLACAWRAPQVLLYGCLHMVAQNMAVFFIKWCWELFNKVTFIILCNTIHTQLHIYYHACCILVRIQ